MNMFDYTVSSYYPWSSSDKVLCVGFFDHFFGYFELTGTLIQWFNDNDFHSHSELTLLSVSANHIDLIPINVIWVQRDSFKNNS